MTGVFRRARSFIQGVPQNLLESGGAHKTLIRDTFT